MKLNKAQKKLIGALVGLSRALDQSNMTYSAYLAATDALRSLYSSSEAELEALYENVRAEKLKAAPDCAVCKNPCGKTFDFDLGELDLLPSEIAAGKYRLIDTAVSFSQNVTCGEDGYADSLALLAEAMYAVGYEYFSLREIDGIESKLKKFL